MIWVLQIKVCAKALFPSSIHLYLCGILSVNSFNGLSRYIHGIMTISYMPLGNLGHLFLNAFILWENGAVVYHCNL
jgi:hypothetical protein